ncbi:hypothetical protein [Iamia sp.]|uniref:hypothetical protein n=1 Tax=Iamia sp. TaxID=2722710 RepID=UPI002CF07334|nr:hypothetical protein [Iamia sp.]HXH56752.1 hypothetical protein [Iamia sp.]
MTGVDPADPVDPARHPAWGEWAAALMAAALMAQGDREPDVAARLEAGVLRQVAGARGWAMEARGLALLASCPPDDPVARSVPPVSEGLAGPELLGAVHEALLDPEARRARGAHYTSPVLAHRLVCWALDGWTPPDRSDGTGLSVVDALSVIDLAVGGGAFLLAAARWQHARGADPTGVLAGLGGVDLDAGAVAVAEAALVGWALDTGWDGAAPVGPHLVVGDGLELDALDGHDGLAGHDGFNGCDRPDGRDRPDGPGGPDAVAGTGAARLGRGRVDLVVGNPPFLGQLSSATARDRAGAARLRERYGRAAGGYVDAAAVFLLAACGWVRPGGRVVLVQPESVLGARDAEGVRAAVSERADLVGLWVAGGSAFAAEVDVCAPVLQVRSSAPDGTGPPPAPGPGVPGPEVPGPDAPTGIVASPATPTGMVASPAVRTAHGFALAAGPARPGPARRSWAPLLADARGVPVVALPGASGHLGDLVTATAGFRQHFYGLAPHLHEAPDGDALDPETPAARAPVLTTGSVDPLTLLWGRRPARIAGRTWSRPVADLDAVAREAPAVAAWVRARLQPKVVVAPQTRVVEAAVDIDGRFVPGVPLVAVEPLAPGRATLWDVENTDGGPIDVELLLWMVAAALSAPPVTAWALRESAGTARGGDALKLSARQVLSVPLPSDRGRWEAAARALRAGRPLVDVGPDLSVAYGLDADHPVTTWWRARL